MSGDRGRARLASPAAAVLAGGASRRMGSDKTRLGVGGVASATRVARLLDRLFEELLLVGGEPPEDAPGRRVPDPEGPQCALRGLVAALEAAGPPRVLVVAADLPLLTPELVLALVAWPEAEVVVPRDDAGRHPLCALYARDAVLPRAREQLAGDRLALHALLDRLEVSELGPEDLARLDPKGRALANMNTSEDAGRIERWLRESGAL